MISRLNTILLLARRKPIMIFSYPCIRVHVEIVHISKHQFYLWASCCERVITAEGGRGGVCERREKTCPEISCCPAEFVSFHPDSNVCISKVGVNRDSDVMGTVCGKKISSALQDTLLELDLKCVS